MNENLITLLISLLFLLFPFLAAGLFCLRGRKNRPTSAPRANQVTKTAETIILFSTGVFALIYIGFINTEVLLNLDKMRPAFATTHIVLICIASVCLLFAAFLSWKGRTSWAIIFMSLVLFFYFFTIKPGDHNSPGYLMAKIAPEYSWESIVNYKFEAIEGQEGAEVWINGVFLGTTPFTITAREFINKVPFLTEPPEDFIKSIKNELTEENYNELKINTMKLHLVSLERRNENTVHGITYSIDMKDYYPYLRYSGQWSTTHGGCNGGSDNYEGNYTVSLTGDFPITQKRYQEKQKRFQILLKKARLADYHVDNAWLETIDTYGEKIWKDIQGYAENEKQLHGILDQWTKWKYGIDDTLSQKQAENILDKICRELNPQSNYNQQGIKGRAIELIYDKLNLENIIRRYEKLIKTRTVGYSFRSIDVIFHAIELWDKKLDNEDESKPDIIEKKLTPALIIWTGDIEGAAKLGGTDIEKYLIRQYRRNTKIEGTELDSENSKYTMGMHLNKWLYNLAFMKSSAAAEFRAKNKQQIIKLAKLMTDSSFNNDREPPEFLFYDLNLGEKSMAYQYWPEYSAQVESSFPPFWQEKLVKRWKYLNRLGSLATEEMYIDCWRTTKQLDNYIGEESLGKAIKLIQIDKRIHVAKEIIKDVQKYVDSKRAELDPEQARYHAIPQSKYINAIKKHLAEIGDEESIQWWISVLEPGPNNDEPQQLREIFRYQNVPDHPLIKIVAQNENPSIRMIAFEAFRRFPKSENRIILEKFLSDSNDKVRNAAKIVEAELEEIKNIPVNELISEPKGN